MDKDNVVYTYSGMQFHLKEEGNPVPCHFVKEIMLRETKEKKPVHSTHVRHKRIVKFIVTEITIVVTRAGGRNWSIV
jgi:hypothetical protein